ncbi:hypothetical protein BBD42_15375 [Paenibacillus sp. BIHB 4019]|uniref:Uncharacterized protein n=1 Tax=Paenibacillus sp. BIHB 4019 TaxID=1870819 RepID=A0A1B2DJ01_9BACL|nr:hypothetical protein [Paenibacillus sp. BIHB 4019]ANY67692.1 hypothetical protein BBD42_15375 [Paenibacillus sp. BIHB 4019]
MSNNVIAAIDPAAGTHFTGKIFVTPHALDEAVKDFGVERAKAPMYVMDNLRRAAFIAHIVNEDGRPSRLFGYRRMAFVVAPDTATVITVYPRHNVNPTLAESVQRVLIRSLKAAARKERAESKRTAVAIATLNVEYAECELRKVRSNSVKTIESMTVRQTEIKREINVMERDLLELRRENTNLANSIIVYL